MKEVTFRVEWANEWANCWQEHTVCKDKKETIAKHKEAVAKEPHIQFRAVKITIESL